jgi:hypothetical protein
VALLDDLLLAFAALSAEDQQRFLALAEQHRQRPAPDPEAEAEWAAAWAARRLDEANSAEPE